MSKKGFLICFLVAMHCQMWAQDPTRETKIRMLSKEWLLQKTESDGKTILPSTALPRFRLVLHENQKCEQGIPPDGMISSTWTLSDNLKEMTFYDTNPAIKTTSGYVAKIILLSTSQLILNITTNNHTSTLYYSLE